MKFTMYEFALMSRFMELGKRYGLEPWQFGVEYDSSTGETYIASGPAGAEASTRFNEMMEALGVPDGERTIPHEEGPEMLTALDAAIQNAPRKWAR